MQCAASLNLPQRDVRGPTFSSDYSENPWVRTRPRVPAREGACVPNHSFRASQRDMKAPLTTRPQVLGELRISPKLLLSRSVLSNQSQHFLSSLFLFVVSAISVRLRFFQP
jgi:hypothetical protein